MQTKPYLRRFLQDMHENAAGRSAVVVVMMAISSLFEGAALAMLFPLLNLAGFPGDGQLAGVVSRIHAAFSMIGMSLTLSKAAAILLAMIVLQHVFYLVPLWIAAGLQAGFIARWRKQLTEAFLHTEWLHFTRENIGSLSHVFSIESRRAGDLLNYGTQVLSLCFTAIVYFVVAFIASWQVTVMLMVGGVAIVTLSQFAARRPAEMTAHQVKLFTRFTSQASEMLGGMKLIRAVNGADAVRRSLSPTIIALRKIERKVLVQPALLRASFEMSAVGALMGTLVFVTEMSISDGSTVVLIAALFVRLYPRISTIQQLVHQFRMSIPYYAAVVDALDSAKAAAEPLCRDDETQVGLSAPPTLTLKNISVAYGEREALRQVSMTIPARQTIGIVGPSGAGKSTLVDALLRLVPVQSGSIEIDGRNLGDIDIGSWRRSVGYVPQDTFLFNASIRENLAFANPSVSLEELRGAARKAHLLDFIDSLPDGIDTIVGDRGVLMSGGQRQRIGLARALVGGKSLLIFDEATAALDTKTEAAIMEDISALHGEITIVLIAHRLSTLRSADKIFVLDSGSLVECGSWTSLIMQDGLFRKLWDMQTEEPLHQTPARW